MPVILAFKLLCLTSILYSLNKPFGKIEKNANRKLVSKLNHK